MQKPPAISLRVPWLVTVASAATTIIALSLFFGLGGHRYFTVSTLAEHRGRLLEAFQRAGAVAPFGFVALYAAVVALSLPASLVMTTAAGFLFGAVSGTFYSVIGATAGAALLFVIVRSGLGRVVGGEWVERLRGGLSREPFRYLLFIRLLPVVPFWLVNLAAPILKVPPRIFVAATAIGVVPGAAVLAGLGNGMGAIIDEGGAVSTGDLLQPAMLVPVVALLALGLATAIRRRRLARARGRS
ncbi:MAG: TVP38/TMEM64 family protein [Geminicoccaceae bacterium]